MKRKVVWLVVSCLVVLALLATSCARAEETAPAVKEAAPAVKEAAPVVKEAAPAEAKEMVKVTLTKLDGTTMEKLVEKPRYGGVFTFAHSTSVLAWDEAYQAPWTTAYYMNAAQENLLRGKWEIGAAGTAEGVTWRFDWFMVPHMTGELAESWELADPETLVFHIRKGVRWHNKPPVNGREFTADDVVFNLKRIYFDIKTSTMYGMAGESRPLEVYTTDKYTVVVKAPVGQTGKTLESVGNLTMMYPPEVIKKYGDHNQWENVTGTGPFILTDYVPMSSAIWVRNPNYWAYDPVLGKDYPLPYLDAVKMLIIPDTSTRLAAWRTGKIDWDNSVYSRDDALPLIKANPELQYARLEPWSCALPSFRVDKPELPFKDIRVRRALMLAINNQEIRDTFFGGDASILNYKVEALPEYKALGWYTELKDLPPETRELYEYHPDKAKQLLAEAGYPNGFKTEIVISSATPLNIDIASTYKGYWAEIGVDLKLDIKEPAVAMSMYQRKTYNEGYYQGRGGVPDSMYTVRSGNMYNTSLVNDPKADQYYKEITEAYFDQPKKNKLVKEMNQYVLSQVWYYSPPQPYIWRFWQPWVKGYNGEKSAGIYNWGHFYRYLWIDQELKKEMGR